MLMNQAGILGKVLARPRSGSVMSGRAPCCSKAPGRHAPVGGQLGPPNPTRWCRGGRPGGAHPVVTFLVVQGDEHLAQNIPHI